MRAGLKRAALASLLTVVCAMQALTAQQSASVGEGGRGEGGAAGTGRRTVRSMTIPVTVKLREQPETPERQELRYIETLIVFEDGEPQEILTTRGAPQSPLTLALLIQDDLVPNVGPEVLRLADFIRRLPQGSRVMVAYLRAGTLQVRQKFTNDLERAAKSLRIPVGVDVAAPFNPYDLTRDALKRFDGQPVGRRALILVSDGVDLSRGASNSTPHTSVDLQRAIQDAQRRGVAVYTIYAPTAGGTTDTRRTFVGNGQSSLSRLSEETGGHAFIQGTSAPVSFERYVREIDTLLSRQFALTYLSTHPGKGFHRIRVASDLTDGTIHYPAGYTR
ncbi:MAG TPA: hypothetical protein VER32_12420 [Pyrinomonadaceae bacterium]|nr:hypothetical protein [Pyrinomonadaceae bacterium]